MVFVTSIFTRGLFLPLRLFKGNLCIGCTLMLAVYNQLFSYKEILADNVFQTFRSYSFICIKFYQCSKLKVHTAPAVHIVAAGCTGFRPSVFGVCRHFLTY